MGKFRRMPAKPIADSPFLPDLFPSVSGPGFALEKALHDRGKHCVAGVDEAGRGPLAGPVVAAAVILDPACIPSGLDDSKRLTAQMRKKLFEQIMASAETAWCAMDAGAIDRLNIRGATLAAMTHAVSGLSVPAEHVLIDGRDVPPQLAPRGTAVIKGDSISQSIAAASIVAKVIRDAIMVRADKDYSGYEFARHKGYGTKIHLEALRKMGPCPLHRKSFAPVALATGAITGN